MALKCCVARRAGLPRLSWGQIQNKTDATIRGRRRSPLTSRPAVIGSGRWSPRAATHGSGPALREPSGRAPQSGCKRRGGCSWQLRRRASTQPAIAACISAWRRKAALRGAGGFSQRRKVSQQPLSRLQAPDLIEIVPPRSVLSIRAKQGWAQLGQRSPCEAIYIRYQTLQSAALFHAALKKISGNGGNSCSQLRVLSSERVG